MVGTQNFQDAFETRKRSFINAFSVCMTLPLKLMIYIMICTTIKVNLISVHILLKVFIVTPKTKKIGKMKDEIDAVGIKEFVALRAKMYSILTTNNKETKKTKGVKKAVVKHGVKQSNYIDYLLNERIYLHSMTFCFSASYSVSEITFRRIEGTTFINFLCRKPICQIGLCEFIHYVKIHFIKHFVKITFYPLNAQSCYTVMMPLTKILYLQPMQYFVIMQGILRYLKYTNTPLPKYRSNNFLKLSIFDFLWLCSLTRQHEIAPFLQVNGVSMIFSN